MSYSEDMRRQRIADDWALRVRGSDAPVHTIGGQMQSNAMKAQEKAWNDSVFPSVPPAPSRPTSPSLPDYGGRPTPLPGVRHLGKTRGGSGGGGPAFPSVDKHFQKIPGKVYVVICVIGALIGLVASGGSASTLGNVIAGAFAGLILIPALKTAVKAALVALGLGVAALILYLMFHAASK